MACLRTILAILLVMLVGFNATNQSSFGDDSNDNQGDDVAAVDCLYLHTQFRLTVPLRELEVTAFAPILNDTAKSPVKKISYSATFLIPARALLSQSGLLPRAPSLA